MAARLSLSFSDVEESHHLDPRQETVAGISETCNLDLRHYFRGSRIRTISRRHFKIVFIKGEGYALYDLDSLNGTRVNGQLVRPGEPVFLKDGDVVMLAENHEFAMAVVSDNYARTEPVIMAATPGAAGAGATARQVLYLAADGQFVLDGTRIPDGYLTALEHKLIGYLYERGGRVCSYDELIRRVWGYAKYEEIQDNTVSKLVSNLRKKLDAISPGAGMRHIQTVHGRGVKCIPG